MLSNAPVAPALPASDMARARAFYEQTLELPVVEEDLGGVTFRCGEGTALLVYPSEFAGTNKATAAAFRVDDLDAVMSRLRERGVVFEDYDLPELKTVDGVATFGDSRGAFFTDPEGNIIGLAQMG
ncbi:MAG TPA: VOC family protein [Miltoncostaeaceae bacterium]|nr:VOC family protein [Miltoncostaeaceae bacterium]